MLFVSQKNLQEPAVSVDGVELRFDAFEEVDKEKIGAFCKSVAIPVLFTLRKKEQGGFFKGSEKERRALLEELLTLEPEYVDIESDTEPSFVERIARKFPHTKILLSYHHFAKTEEDLFSLWKQMESPFAYAYKIASFAQSTTDALRMLLFVRKMQEKRVAGMCMGEKGQITRILGPCFGSFIDFAAPNNEEAFAPGQLSVDELLSVYHYGDLSAKTALCGLIGFPLVQSMANYTHNAVMRHEKLDAVYVKMLLQSEELPLFFSLAKECSFLGLSVTMPLKEKVLPFLDEIDPVAKEIGAVNTVRFCRGKMEGFNTDARGALDAIEEREEVQGKRVVVLGAGGAARAIAYEARRRGAELVILNRTREKASLLAQELGGESGGLEDLAKHRYDVLINATPDPLPVSAEAMQAETVVMDAKSYPLKRAFLLEAEKRGARLVFGYEMFVNQAWEQFHIWFDRNIDKSYLAKRCLEQLQR